MKKKLKAKRVFVHYVHIGNVDTKDIQGMIDMYKTNTAALAVFEDVVQVYVPSRIKEGIEVIY